VNESHFRNDWVKEMAHYQRHSRKRAKQFLFFFFLGGGGVHEEPAQMFKLKYFQMN